MEPGDWDAELDLRREQRRGRAVAVPRAKSSAKSSEPRSEARRSESEGPGVAGARTLSRLRRAAADFLVSRKAPDGTDGTSVIAGYPWFADWGRDTMISLPGLLLATGRFEQARQVLSVFGSTSARG